MIQETCQQPSVHHYCLNSNQLMYPTFELTVREPKCKLSSAALKSDEGEKHWGGYENQDLNSKMKPKWISHTRTTIYFERQENFHFITFLKHLAHKKKTHSGLTQINEV